MKTDLDRAQEELAKSRALPDDAPNREDLIRHWRDEVQALRVNIAQDRRSQQHTARYMKARRKENAV